MKQCPTCSRVYADETLRFCLDDGASLVPQAQPGRPQTTIPVKAPRTHVQQVTEVLPGGRADQAGQKPPVVPWIVAGVSVLLVGIMGLGLLVFVVANRGSTTPNINKSASPNINSSGSGSPSSIIQLSGTSWTDHNEHTAMTEYKFLSNGTINNDPKDTWSQVGNVLYMEINDHYAHYEGTITADTIEYKANNKVSFQWTGTLHRAKP